MLDSGALPDTGVMVDIRHSLCPPELMAGSPAHAQACSGCDDDQDHSETVWWSPAVAGVPL